MSHLPPRLWSFVAALALSLFVVHASAQTVVWSDNFDSYAAQSVDGSLGLEGAAEAPGVWTDFGGFEPFHIDATFALSGANALRLDEGDAAISDGYGSDAFVNLPEVYESGSYTLSYSLFVTAAMDTYHSSVIGHTSYPINTIWSPGLYIDYDAQSAVATTPAVLPILSPEGTLLESLNVTPSPLVTGRWVENVVEIDLENNRFQWTYDGNVVVPFGEVAWDPGEANPKLGSIDLYVGFSFEGADENGVTGSVYYDDFVLTRNDNVSLICDADGDGDCDHADIDALYTAFGTSGGPLDLNGNGTVDTLDIGPWLNAASSSSNTYKANDDDTYVFGDVNLSGEVTSADLGLLLNNFGAAGGTWDEGNLNGIDGIDSTDLGLLLNNFGFPAASAVASVPEPGSLLFAFFGLIGILPALRKKVV